MSVFRILLLPFAMLYDAVTAVRNRLFDMNYKPSVRFEIPVISVGNLAVGGTGKTPMVEHLIRLLQPEYKIATLSRGYGRKTKGFKIANTNDTAATVGDEPFQLYRKFAPGIDVVVGEDRAYAIPMLLQELNSTLVIMDDAYQHRSVIPGLSILLTEYSNPFYNDHLLPYGRLREAPEGARRADVIVVTKCPPQLSDDEAMEAEKNIRTYSDKPVFFSKIRYGEPVSFGKDAVISKKVILVSAIANAHILESYVSTSYTMLKHFAYRDHYVITSADLREIDSMVQKYPKGEVSILTTEKDMVKLQREELKSQVSQLQLFYLPIETEFIRNGKDFDTLVLSFMQSFKPD